LRLTHRLGRPTPPGGTPRVRPRRLLGGIAFPPFRAYGLLYQVGGVAALWPGGAPLPVFALTTAAANLWMSYAVWREQRGQEAG
jgi:hypothetical protein